MVQKENNYIKAAKHLASEYTRAFVSVSVHVISASPGNTEFSETSEKIDNDHGLNEIISKDFKSF